MTTAEPANDSKPIGVGWKLAVFAGATAVSFLLARLAVPLLSDVIERISGLRIAAWPWVVALGALGGHLWTLRLVERRGWQFVGLSRSAARPALLTQAVLLGSLAVALPTLLLVAFGLASFSPSATAHPALAGLSLVAHLAPAALGEELLARGYPFAVVRERWNGTVAIAGTSALFGLAHLQNIGASLASVLMVTLVGVLLGVVRHVWNSLWAAWLAHLAWNLTLAGALHAAVSGVVFNTSRYHLVEEGPDWLTGGTWGPEGGLMAALGAGLAIAFVLWRRPRRKELRDE